MEKTKAKQLTLSKLVKQIVIVCLLCLTTGILITNALYVALYGQTSSSYQEYWSMNPYIEVDRLCIVTTLYDIPPHFILPAFKVKFAINGETVPLTNMYVSLDRNEYSFDILTNGAKNYSENSAILILPEGASGCIS